MKEFDNLVKTIKILRSPGGCPWDRAQSVSDYKKHLLEEAYELIDELDEGNFSCAKEELGDLFLILIVIVQMLSEKSRFNLRDVLGSINKKLIHRHPHVFKTEKLKTKEDVYAYWIRHKARVKKRKTIKDRLPKTAPALLLADLFIKERENLNGKDSKKIYTTVGKTIDCAKHKLDLFLKDHNKTRLCEIMLDLSGLAYIYKINLEHRFRKTIFEEAAKVYYGK